jgi:hypothetical protein
MRCRRSTANATRHRQQMSHQLRRRMAQAEHRMQNEGTNRRARYMSNLDIGLA